MRVIPLLVLAMLLLVLLPGCQQSKPEPAAVNVPQLVEPTEVLDTVVSEGTEVDPTEALWDAMASYVAPFPERTELFIPPKEAPLRSHGASADGDVQLRGLVDVGEPQAILDIEGAVALVGVGGEKFGVKVVSINHHKVVLERGGTRWTASLD